MVTGNGARPASAEQRLKELGINLPTAPEPFGIYAEAAQAGNLLFLAGMLPTEGGAAKFTGRVGAELDVPAGRKAAQLAALNALAVARQHLGSLDKVTRIVNMGVFSAFKNLAVHGCRPFPAIPHGSIQEQCKPQRMDQAHGKLVVRGTSERSRSSTAPHQEQFHPTVLLLDEFQTSLDGLSDTPKAKVQTWAYNFIQLRSEIASDNRDLLMLVASNQVRDGSSSVCYRYRVALLTIADNSSK